MDVAHRVSLSGPRLYRVRSTSMRALALAPLALSIALSGCFFGSYSRAVEETKAELIGLPARDLRECLGAPEHVEILGELEKQTYRFELVREGWSISSGSGMGGRVVESRGAARRDGFGTSGAPPKGWCELDFELRGGAVAGVAADGRDVQGMNAAGACMLEARRCIPYEDEPES
jgi:hypothetical protein